MNNTADGIRIKHKQQKYWTNRDEHYQRTQQTNGLTVWRKKIKHSKHSLTHEYLFIDITRQTQTTVLLWSNDKKYCYLSVVMYTTTLSFLLEYFGK